MGYNSIIISIDIKKIPFITATKKIKYLIRNMQNLYEKIFKALLKDTEVDEQMDKHSLFLDSTIQDPKDVSYT